MLSLKSITKRQMGLERIQKHTCMYLCEEHERTLGLRSDVQTLLTNILITLLSRSSPRAYHKGKT